MVLFMLAWTTPLVAGAQSAAPAYEVTLPAGYETDGLNYPVLYVLPQDGYTADDSGLAQQLTAAMESDLGTDMLIVRPAFAAGADVVAEMKAVVEAVDGAYRTIADPAHRAVAGVKAGGYLAYVLTLAEETPFSAAVSIRGDFASEENPWIATYGSIFDKMEAMHAANETVFDGFYTYMDAPVDDKYTNMEGSTNDLGALMIGYGTGSAFHEFTVRPGAYDEAFLSESAVRVMNRLTTRMLSGVAGGTIALEKTTLTADDANANVTYTVKVSDAIAAHAAGEMALDVTVAVVDPKTGETLAETKQAHTITGAGEVSGTAAVANVVNGSSANVNLNVTLLGTTTNVATATLIRAQEAIVDGDYQQIELLGDWYFNYVGAQTSIDVPTLTAEEFTTWSVVQPGLASWKKGFGNISDENVASAYGPDYFDYFIVGNGYYAKTFTVPENFDAKELVLSIGYVDDRCEVFLNGVRVGATGMDENGQPTGETTWAVFSNFAIDPAVLNIGGENTVVVRNWNDLPFGGGGWYAGPIGLYSKTAFDAQYAEGANPRFFEDTFESAHVAAANGQEGVMENKYLIYLPEGYEESGRSYPTVYLLHQFNSDHTSYRTDKIDQLLDAGIAAGLFDEMIVVIPNSNENSWWSGDWEKMITDELIPLIDSNYRTIRDARYRLTAGCSMGGQGAMAVALRNPDYFSGVISFFGAFSYGGESSPNAIAAVESKEYMDYFTMYFICGNQDSYGFGAPAVELNQQLEALGVEHRFFIENGGHDSAFYVPYFNDGFAYVRANMYKSDEAVEKLLSGSVAVDGANVKAELTAAEGIAAYMHAIPASSYTINAAPALSVPVSIEVVQDGEVVYVHADRDVLLASEDLTKTIEIDLTGKVDTAKTFTVTFKAEIFDRVVTLVQ